MLTLDKNIPLQFNVVHEGEKMVYKFVVNDENYIDIYIDDQNMDTMYDVGTVTTRAELRAKVTHLFKCWGYKNVNSVLTKSL